MKQAIPTGWVTPTSRYKNCDCTDGCRAHLKKYLKKNPHRSDIREYLNNLSK